ncbi:hypothetical protein [Aequorivita marina]|uniref:hypothetical protein n=1 Tax=Aequorivita marina TaxID=3073654 RepID=UPI002876E93E|nr:hypothetical protein [Aequorivita sp. S2608]MDS1299100.1 hypothetical protein [Aequorivita sp. S2608]
MRWVFPFHTKDYAFRYRHLKVNLYEKTSIFMQGDEENKGKPSHSRRPGPSRVIIYPKDIQLLTG